MPELRFRAADGSVAVLPVTVSENPPTWTPRSRTYTKVANPPYQQDTAYIDCTGVSVPIQAARITVVQDQIPTSQLKGVADVWVGGRPGQLMNAGPRSDGNDLLQIKRWPVSTGTIPDGVTLAYIHFHDVTRPGSEHPDGIQMMCGRNGRIEHCVFERVDIQPLFFRDGGQTAGGGPISDWAIEDNVIRRPPNGFYALRIAGNSDQNVPTRVIAKRNVIESFSIDQAAQALGCRVE